MTQQMFDDLIGNPPPSTIDVDAIVQVGTNLSMVDVAARHEERLGKPVIAINTATYWHALRTMGFKDKVEGLGRLLSQF